MGVCNSNNHTKRNITDHSKTTITEITKKSYLDRISNETICDGKKLFYLKILKNTILSVKIEVQAVLV